MESTSCTIYPAGIAVESFDWFSCSLVHSLGCSISGRSTVGRCALAIGLFLWLFTGLNFLPFVVVNIPSKLEVQVSFRNRGCRECSICRWMRFAWSCKGTRAWLKGLQSAWCVRRHFEVSSKRRANIGRTGLWINLLTSAQKVGRQSRRSYLVVNQTPLFQEGVHSHNRANVACQIPSACSHGQVFNGV